MNLETKVTALIVGAALFLTAGISGIIYGRNQHIKNNLDSGAIICNAMDNLKPVIGVNLPEIRNKDLDNDGKYESALFYKDSQGKIIYQEITRNKDGILIFNEPKFYEH
jgi:hypothetical protein